MSNPSLHWIQYTAESCNTNSAHHAAKDSGSQKTFHWPLGPEAEHWLDRTFAKLARAEQQKFICSESTGVRPCFSSRDVGCGAMAAAVVGVSRGEPLGEEAAVPVMFGRKLRVATAYKGVTRCSFDELCNR